MPGFSRRDFLKAASLVSAGALFNRFYPSAVSWAGGSQKGPNILILVMDALSARNMSLYGYVRNTTPNIARFAERSTVYHSHYAGGNYTSPGTGSILTGTYPWTHRAINMRGTIAHSLVDKDLFALAGDDYYRVAYTQNMLADVFLRQSAGNIDLHMPLDSFPLNGHPSLKSSWFANDPLAAYYAFDDSTLNRTNTSTFLFNFLNVASWKSIEKYSEPSPEYPFGTPFNSFNFFDNRVVYDALGSTLLDLAQNPKPFLTYFHLYSPHEPFSPRQEFVGKLIPDIPEPNKPFHPLSLNHFRRKDLMPLRQKYDEFISDVDDNFGRLIDQLENAGILDTTYVFLLSDHGELFERGEHGHLTPLMYDALLHIPLIVHEPGQKVRRDVFAPTSNTDILPTISRILQKEPDPVYEGKLLPGLGGVEDLERSIFSVEAKLNPARLPITRGSISMIKGNKKLIYYFGYEDQDDIFELYDLHEDIDELDDLFTKDKVTAARMKQELLDSLSTTNNKLRR